MLYLLSQLWRWRKRVPPKCWCPPIFWTLSVCLQAMKDKMNISRGRERDRTARQVRPHRLIGVINVDWKMGKCKCRRLLMAWHLQDRGGTRLPLALLFTFDTIFTFGWVHLSKYKSNTVKQIQELLFVKMENGRSQWCEVVIWWLGLLRIVWFGCCCCTITRSCQVLCQTLRGARLSNSRLLHFAGSRCKLSDCRRLFLVCEATL